MIALGGGAVTSAITRERLRDGSFTVLLDVSPQTAWRRVEAEAGDRPLAVEARALRRALRAAPPALPRDRRRPGRRRRARSATSRCWCRSPRQAALAELPRLVGARRPALVADREVLRLVGPPFEPFVTVRLPAGEAAKTVAVARQAWTRLAELGLERGDVVVGLGGGAATDVAGFVAATYQRGVPWIAVPTSLIGMVDAAIGGKTGIDLPEAKNYVGAFHQAEWVVSRSGGAGDAAGARVGVRFAEVIKTGLLAGGRLWEMVQGWEPGRGTPEDRLELIRRCAAYKARVVADDPTEQGVRAVLNLGHSIGHAIETAARYRASPRRGGGGRPAAGAVAVGAGVGPRSAVEQQVRELLELHELPTVARGVDRRGGARGDESRQEGAPGAGAVRPARGRRQAGFRD